MIFSTCSLSSQRWFSCVVGFFFPFQWLFFPFPKSLPHPSPRPAPLFIPNIWGAGSPPSAAIGEIPGTLVRTGGRRAHPCDGHRDVTSFGDIPGAAKATGALGTSLVTMNLQRGGLILLSEQVGLLMPDFSF